MRHLQLQLAMVASTVAMLVVALGINHWLFMRLEFALGISWIYLPAGVRLLAVLLFAETGAAGLLVAELLVGFLWFFPDDPQRAVVGAITAAASPYLLYLAACRRYGLQASLANLTPRRLLTLAVVNAVVGPFMHHLFYAWRGQPDLLRGYIAMVTGDLAGTLIVIYGCRALLHVLAARPR
ncbi:MAG: hypothetical protein NVS2B4_15330 [Ramlibacter sp.]